MNKAFVKETDQDDEDEVPAHAAIPAGSKNYLTPAGYQALIDEQLHLVKVERPEVVNIVSWAASNGDRSENGDYLYGKKRLREIDRRIRYLNKRLDAAQVVDPSQQPNKDQIFFGANVLYTNSAGEDINITIVGIDEAQPAKGFVSWTSPVARALLKAREGDVVTLRTPAGIDELEVLEIKYPEQ